MRLNHVQHHPIPRAHAAESVDLAEEEVPTIVLPNGERLEFPGCRAYKMSLSELEEYEGRYEYWYGPTETLIVVARRTQSIVSGDHELPAPYLMQLVQQIAEECGAHFVPFGTVSIWDAECRGRPSGRHASRSVPLLASPVGAIARQGRVEVGLSHLARCGVGSRSHDRHSAGEAASVCVVGLSRSVGRSPRGVHA